MAKGSGGTRGAKNSGSSSSTNSTLGGGSGTLKRNDFDSMKLSDFEGQAFMGGANYTVSTKDGAYQMDIDIDNGYNDIYESEGATISISMRKTGDYRSEENIYNGFVELSSYRQSGGVLDYGQYTGAASRYLNNVMPYLKDLARGYVKRHS